MTLPQHNLRDDRIHAIVEDFEREHGPDARMSRKEFEAAYGELCPSELADRDARSRVLHAFHLKYKDTYGKSNAGRRKPRPRRSKEAEERKARKRAERAASAERATDSEAEGATDAERATDTEAERAANAEPAADSEAERAAITNSPASSSAQPFITAPLLLKPIREDPEPDAPAFVRLPILDDEPAFVRVSRLAHNGLSSEVADKWLGARAMSQHQWDGASLLRVARSGRATPCEAAATVRSRGAYPAGPMRVPTADMATSNWPPLPKQLPDAT
jgi:hypothetical protein